MENWKKLKELACREIDHRGEELIAFGTDIWNHPETGYCEFRTARAAAEKLESFGIEVRRDLALTGFRGDLKTGRKGPVVALLGEMDALHLPSHPEADPRTGAVHACGHNAHITALVGAAAGLSAAGVLDSCSGTVALVGVPAEESLDAARAEELRSAGKIHFTSGKAELIRCGAFDDVDIAMMNHAGGSFCVADFNGYLLKEVTFHGKSVHAASPDQGINAMNALQLALHALALTGDRWTSEPNLRMHGIVTGAGDAVNIVPDRASLTWMLRADTPERLHRMSSLFDQAVNGSAYALGARCEITTRHGCSPLKNSDALCEIYRRCVEELLPGAHAKIKEFFIPGSTDMGDLSRIVPVLHGYFPGCAGACHSRDFRIADREKAYLLSSKLLACMTLELLAGNAETGTRIAREKTEKLSIPEYRKEISSFETHSVFPPEE